MNTNINASGVKSTAKADKIDKVSFKLPEKTSMKDEISKPSPQGNQHGNRRRAFKKPMTRQPRFQGKCDELKGHIYDCSDSRQSDVYTKTTKEIGEYVGRTYRYGSDVRRAVQKLTMPATMPAPADPADGTNHSVVRMWKKKIDEFVKRELALEENLRTLYTLVWGQCTEIVRARLEAFDGYERMSEDYDSLTLLKAIKSIAFNFQSTKYKPDALNASKRRLYMLVQDKFATRDVSDIPGQVPELYRRHQTLWGIDWK
jgi:hypothetical protein